jgi:hypothetical protein
VEEFTNRIAAINREELKAYLSSLQASCYESNLLQIAFPKMDIALADPLILYQNHFLLFHVLYQLQDEFMRAGQYLYIHFMRTSLTPYPSAGKCRFFEETLGQFCQARCQDSQSYCAFHARMLGETALEELSIKYFYLDAQNFYKLNADTAMAFINGTWEILAHYDAYKRSFEILGLPENADLKLIKKKFKQLAKLYHPDLGASSHDKFQEINNAYQLLVHLYSGMMALPTSLKPYAENL